MREIDQAIRQEIPVGPDSPEFWMAYFKLVKQIRDFLVRRSGVILISAAERELRSAS
jgi:hypothetical protein